MKKIFWAITAGFMTLACLSPIPTPDDFPPPPMTVIVEFPTVVVTPTLEMRLAPITQEKMQEAETFLLILKTRVISGDSTGIAEMVHYPIDVYTNGKISIANADEFVKNYDSIFNEKIMAVLTDTKDASLILLPDGILVGNGEIWINLFCVDLVCSETQFLITRINN
jgi:hypothetical protein